jgi:hypothetical protein
MQDAVPNAHFTFSRAKYDGCNLQKDFQESTGPFQWVTDQSRNKHTACHIAHSGYIPYNKGQGIYDVEAESDLYGINRVYSRCPQGKYLPTEDAMYKKTHMQECKSNTFLEPQYTRTKRPCNVLSGVSINRFQPLCEDPQKKIHDNSFIGSNTRLTFKDKYQQIKYPEFSGKRKTTGPISPYKSNTYCCPRA